LSYKLYIGGYRHIQGVTVAKDDTEAEVKLREELRLGSLPCEFSEVDLGEYAIVLKDEQPKKEVTIDKSKKPPKK
jgi:L-lactate utilization protein LutB